MGEFYREQFRSRLQTYIPPKELAEPLADLARIPVSHREAFFRGFALASFTAWEMHFDRLPRDAIVKQLDDIRQMADQLNASLDVVDRRAAEWFEICTGWRLVDFHAAVMELSSAASFACEKLGPSKRPRGGQRKSGSSCRPAFELFVTLALGAVRAAGGKLTSGKSNPGTLRKFITMVTPWLPPTFFVGLSQGALYRITKEAGR